MSESIDPYLKWLGIRDSERPPNHYRLLGLELFESDPEVINAAADRQMSHVRTFQSGPNAALSQTVLNELAVARRCLLNEQSRADYDNRLRTASAKKPPKIRSFYEILGISPDSDEPEIRQGYRRAVQDHHPDHNPDDRRSAKRTRHLNAARDTLLDPETRRQYDAKLRKRGILPDEPVADEPATDRSTADSGETRFATDTDIPDLEPAPSSGFYSHSFQIESEPKPDYGQAANTPRQRTTSRRKRDSRAKVIITMIMIPLGGIAGVSVAILLLWVGFGMDPFGLFQSDTKPVAQTDSDTPPKTPLQTTPENRRPLDPPLATNATKPETPLDAVPDPTSFPTPAKAHQKALADNLGVPVETTNSIGMKLKLIPAGEFQMGSGKSASAIARLFNSRSSRNILANVDPSVHSESKIWRRIDDAIAADNLLDASWFSVPGNIPEEYDLLVSLTIRREAKTLANDTHIHIPAHGKLFPFVIRRLNGKTLLSFWPETNKKSLLGSLPIGVSLDSDNNSFATKRMLSFQVRRSSFRVSLDGKQLFLFDSLEQAKSHTNKGDQIRLGSWQNEVIFHSVVVSPVETGTKEFKGEHPQHLVKITKPFYLGVHEVTVGQFRQFTQAEKYRTEAERDGQGGWGYNATKRVFEGPNPQYGWKNAGWRQEDTHPVVNVTRNDAMEFCRWLSNKEGTLYRLPTEAEWEYACRAGTDSFFSGGDDVASLESIANIADSLLRQKVADVDWSQPWDDGYSFTAPVGRFRPNPWGLYDMHGNVWEWCQDWYAPYGSEKVVSDPMGPARGDDRLLRGGAFDQHFEFVRSAVRNDQPAGTRSYSAGFRIVRSSVENTTPPSDSAANKTFAQLEFPAGPQIKPLAVGLPIHSDRHAVWATVPDELKGLQVTQWKCLQGRSDVNVASPGRVVMAASPRWGTAGSGGPWQQELTTEQQLFDDGWVKIATIDVKTDDPNKPSPWTVYEREFQGGEEIRLRTDKYMAPRFFFPASKTPLGGETTNASPPPPPANAPFDADTAKAHQQAWADYLGLPVEFENSIGLKMRLVPPGQFMMGEDQQHAVTLTGPFYLGIHEVSQREFRKVQNDNPSQQVGPENPVERVTWDEAVVFCQKLSQLPAERKIDRVYRLPTEAEWEYACRAGTTTDYFFGDNPGAIGDFAWDRSNSDRKTHPVGEKKANRWGYHDMLGNVAEWCSDWKGDYPATGVTDPTGPVSGTARIIRGGSYASGIDGLKSGARPTKPLVIRERYTNRGFRVVLPIPDEYFKKTATVLPPDQTMEIKFDDNQGKNATSIPNDQQIKDGFLVIQPHSQVLLGQYFSRFSSIKIRGKIQAPGNDNLRFTAGPVRGILNWEHGGNVFMTLLPAPPGAKHDDRARERTKIEPAALESGKLHEILIAKGEGNKISVSVDGKELFTTEAEFFGTLAIQAQNTPIEIESISLTGVIDPNKQADGWSHY